MIKNCLCVLGLSFALGCATAVVRPYVGEQQAWPTANGSIANVRYALPVFTSLPPAAYEVLAELRINSPLYERPIEGHLKTLVKTAIKLEADALVFVDGQAYFGTTYGVRSGDTGTGAPAKKTSVMQVNRFNPDSFKPGVSIVAIRWADEPPPGLPPRYAKYSPKMLEKVLEEAEEEMPAPEAAPAPADPEPAAAAPTPPPPPAAVAPAAPAMPEPVPAPVDPPQADATPEPHTNFRPKNEAAPALTAPPLNLSESPLPATPEN